MMSFAHSQSNVNGIGTQGAPVSPGALNYLTKSHTTVLIYVLTWYCLTHRQILPCHACVLYETGNQRAKTLLFRWQFLLQPAL